MRKLKEPNRISVEPVRGCDFGCITCPLHPSTDFPKQKMYMSEEVASAILDSILNFSSRIRVEMAQRGEPTLHPNLTDILKLWNISKHQLTLTTHGNYLTVDSIINYFKSGLNILIVDMYERPKHEWERLNSVLDKINKKIPVVSENNFNPWKTHRMNIKRIVKVKSFFKKEKGRRLVTGRCGLMPDAGYKHFGVERIDPNEPLPKRCVRPFRELVIHYDGVIPLCCEDWERDCVLGNVIEKDLLDLWFTNRKLEKYRVRLYNKNRDLEPCNRCDYMGGFYKHMLPEEYKDMEIL